ncbi:hypothetical protein [Terasakiella sp. SH-1]|uniref:hypothetical protein n=1 Tax=Terasakiella sp. SH-1 TaxID=2560057 RepID=UPI001073DAFB|nr:hypothetical protein [Terasakiella sp. SH-1]
METTNLLLVGCFFALGYFLRKRKEIVSVVSRLNVYLLYAFIFVSITTVSFDYGLSGWLWLAIAGFLIQCLPTLLGARYKKLSSAYFSYGTYGGGNRGVLLLSTTSPHLLPGFLIADLFNFLSLAIVYPACQHHQINRENLTRIGVLVALISTAFTLNYFEAGAYIDELIIAGIGLVVKIGISFQLGSALSFTNFSKTVFQHLGKMLFVRFPIFLPIALLYWLHSEIWLSVLVFFILPTSSFSMVLSKEEIKEEVAQAMVISNLLYIISFVMISLFVVR